MSGQSVRRQGPDLVHGLRLCPAHRRFHVASFGQHVVKEPTEPNGTPRYSCDIENPP